MKETHEVWVEGNEEGIVHIGTPKQIMFMLSKDEIASNAIRVLELPNTTFEEAEEAARLYMEDNELQERSDEV